jgi:hypothetical protein
MRQYNIQRQYNMQRRHNIQLVAAVFPAVISHHFCVLPTLPLLYNAMKLCTLQRGFVCYREGFKAWCNSIDINKYHHRCFSLSAILWALQILDVQKRCAEWGIVAVMQLDNCNVFIKVCGCIIFLPVLGIYYLQCIHQISRWKAKRQLLNELWCYLCISWTYNNQQWTSIIQHFSDTISKSKQVICISWAYNNQQWTSIIQYFLDNQQWTSIIQHFPDNQ